MKTLFVCPRCGNDDPASIGIKNGEPYCRRCIGFHGDLALTPSPRPKTVALHLGYSLSAQQRELSEKLIANFQGGIDTLVYAVCGSGKTEISYGIIGYAMSKGLTVGFALPRRDVVIELYHRFVAAFPSNRVIAVYGGHNDTLEGDLVLLTTHQLFRYPNYFDLLVMDEIDAFPFKGNETLIAFYRKSMRGHCVMMSATPSKAIIQEFRGPGKDMISLRTRFHKKPIPVPESKIAYGVVKYAVVIRRLKRYKAENKPCLVFVPTVDMAKRVFRFLHLFVRGGNYVSSKRRSRSRIIADFKKRKYAYLVTTAVLERGVTIRDVQVIVFDSDNAIYDSAALIQIAGRAGRKMDAPTGEVLFVAEKESKGMKDAIEEIKYCNSFL